MRQACSKRICYKKNTKKANKSFKSSDGIPSNLSSIKRGRTSKTKVSRKIQQKKQKIVNDVTCGTSEDMIQAPKKRGRPPKNKENFSPKVKTSKAKLSSSSNKASEENEDIGTLSDNSSDTFATNLWTGLRSAEISENPFISEQDMQIEGAHDKEEEEGGGKVKENFADPPDTVDIKIEEAWSMEEEENGKVQQNIVDPPATVIIKQEISSDEDEEMIIEYEKITEKVTTFRIKQENENSESQSLEHPSEEISINGQIVTVTPVEKSSQGPSVSPSNPKQHSGPHTNHLPGQLQDWLARYGITVTPSRSVTNLDSGAAVTAGNLHRSQTNETVNHMSDGSVDQQKNLLENSIESNPNTDHRPGTSVESRPKSNQPMGTSVESRPKSNQPMGTSVASRPNTNQSPGTSKSPANHQVQQRTLDRHEVTITPVRNSENNAGRPRISQENVPVNHRGNEDIGQPGNLSIKIGNGEVTIHKEGVTVEMKCTDLEISGQADYVYKMATKYTPNFGALE